MAQPALAHVVMCLLLSSAAWFTASTSVGATDSTRDEHTETSASAPKDAGSGTAPKVAPSKGASAEPVVPAASVSAEQALKWLMNGNARYMKLNFRKDGRGPEDRKRAQSREKPHAIVLSSADSRVPTELIFDQGIGEIYVVRVMGVALDSSVIASLEYAVEHLGAKLLVVMGNSQCPAVRAAVNLKNDESAGSEALDKVIAEIRPRLRTVLKDGPSPNLEVEAAVNADGVARDLLNRSAIIKKKVNAGELTIKSALYRIDSGKVSFY